MSQQAASGSQPRKTEKNATVDDLEAEHFRSIVEVFKQYEAYSLSANNRRRKDFYKLPLSHQRLLEELGWRKRLEDVDKRIAVNAAFLREVVDSPDIFAIYDQPLPEEPEKVVPKKEGVVHGPVPPPPSNGERQSKFHDAPNQQQKGNAIPPNESTVPAPKASSTPLNPSARVAVPHDPAAQSTTIAASSSITATESASHANIPGAQEQKPGNPLPIPEVAEVDDHPYARLRREHDHQHQHEHMHEHSDDCGRSHAYPPAPTAAHRPKVKGTIKKVSDFDMDKLRSTLKQFARDWSLEGKPERDASYKPMLDAMMEHFSDVKPEDRRNFKVLVPGTGLGRLAWEIAVLGFSCQGNEFSHFMLLTSYWMLNKSEKVDQHTIYPYIHSFSNVMSTESMLRSITIPDILPSHLPDECDFTLVAGDFEEIYGISDKEVLKDESGREAQERRWHAVMTCFFIDTAKDIVSYLSIIHRILAPGGVWINLGPLLWHYENTGDPSIELNLEEVKELSRMIGFEITNERIIPTTYTGNAESMLRHEYQAAFWVGKKK